MLKYTGRWIFFLSSYIPLYVMLIVQNFNFSTLEKNITAVNLTLLCITVLSGALIFLLIYSKDCETLRTKKICLKRDEILNYFITYLIPLLTFDPGKINSILVSVIVFISVGILYTTNSLLLWNPVLSLFKYKLYAVDNEAVLLSKKSEDVLARAISDKSQILAKQILPNIYIEKKIVNFSVTQTS